MRHRTSNSLADTAGNNDDNIRVAHTRATDSGDDDKGSPPESKNLKLAQLESDKYDGKGKAHAQLPEQDVDMMDIDHNETGSDDDNVTEYSFKSEDYPHESELEDLDDDARSHISLSDDEPEVSSVIGPVDWKELTRDQRVEYERMFGSVHHQPLNGSWTFTENYHRHIDEQCLTYLDAFKPEEWVLPRHDTEYILNKLLERIRMRKAHTKVYGPPAHNSSSRSHQLSHHHSQAPLPPPGHHMSGNQMLRSQPSVQPMGEPPGVRLGQPLRQPMAFAQSQQYQNGGLPAGPHPGHPIRGPPYPMPGQMPPQPIPPLRSNMGLPAKAQRKLKINVADRGHREQALQVPLPLKAPTPPYPLRDRPDQRKTVGKAGRGKTRRQAEADEFPWNRDLDFIAARDALQSKDTWDLSVYDQAMLDEMERCRVRNKPVVEVLEEEITAKQKVARKKKNPPAKTEASSEEDGEGEAEAEHENQDVVRRTKGGRKKSRSAGESGSDPYHSGNFAFASPEDQQLASTMGMRNVDELIDAGMTDKLSLDELFRIKICWSPGKKGNSQDLEQAKFSVKDTVTTRKMLDKTPILSHRAGECIIDFCPDLLWRDILLRILSEAGFSNKDIRDRFCLNGSFSDRATVAKRLSAALGKDTNPPRGKGKEAALDWCETNRDDFDNYQAFFGKRPPARRTAQGRKNSKLLHGKTIESEENSSPLKNDSKGEGSKKLSKMALDGAADEEASAAEESDGEDQEDAVSLQDSDELDAMSD